MKRTTLLLTLLLGISFSAIISQNQLLTIQDAIWKGRTSLAPKRLQALGFIPDSKKIAYIEKNELIILSAETGKTITTLSIASLNKGLKTSSIDTVTAFEGLKWINENQFYFTNKKGEWLYSLDKNTATKSERKQSDFSLDNLEIFKEGEVFAYVNLNNVFVSVNGKVNQVTTDGSYTLVNGKTVHQSEFGITKGLFWSPNGNALAYYKMDQADVDDYPIIDWTTYPATNKNIKYPMAGKKSHYVTVLIYNLKNNTSTKIKTEGPKEQYLTNIAFSPDEKYIYMAV